MGQIDLHSSALVCKRWFMVITGFNPLRSIYIGEESEFRFHVDSVTFASMINILRSITTRCTLKIINQGLCSYISIKSTNENYQCSAVMKSDYVYIRDKVALFTIETSNPHLDIIPELGYYVGMERMANNPTIFISKYSYGDTYQTDRLTDQTLFPSIGYFPKGHSYKIVIPRYQLAREIELVNEFGVDKIKFTIMKLKKSTGNPLFFLETSMVSMKGELHRFHYSAPVLETKRREKPSSFKSTVSVSYPVSRIGNFINSLCNAPGSRDRDKSLVFRFSPNLPMAIEYLPDNSQFYIKVAFL